MCKFSSISLCLVLLLNTASIIEPAIRPPDKYDRTSSKNGRSNSIIISPDKAWMMSFIPCWSECWNTEFAGTGFICQPFKIFGSFNGLCMFSSIPYYLILDKDIGSSGNADEGAGWIFCAGYSPDFIEKYNPGRDNAYNAEETGEQSDVLSFKPYIVWRKKAENERKAFDGIGICLKYNI